jgi:hypothetical protein
MSKVLVTTDYSSNSKAAIRFAIQFAAQLKCELVFYHIYEGLSDDSWNIVEGAEVGGGSPDDRVNKLNKYSFVDASIIKLVPVPATIINSDVSFIFKIYFKWLIFHLNLFFNL